MIEIFQYDFMINAIIASVLASIAFGIVGTYVVVKRIVFISGGISHSAYGGIGLAFLVGFNPLVGGILFSIGSAGIIAYLRKKGIQFEDTLIGILWAFGMALGVIFIDLAPGYAPNLMSYLFGNILTIGVSELYLILSLDLIILLIVGIFFRQFQAVTFDEEFASTIGLPVNLIYTLLLIVIALTTVILIRLVGIILVVALLSIPSAISINFAKSLKRMMFLSTLLGLIFTIFGLILSFYLNLASGAAIIVVSVIGYLISLLLKSKKIFIKNR
ncbi:MAG: hypothetical protein CMF23_14915 [Ignavibacteriae bacterium]|jgi:zinc transport system permease protein|nr:hypothetical protein [Ignavibacteriota bacterium]